MHMRDLTRQVQLTESRNFAAGGCGVVQKGVLRVNKVTMTAYIIVYCPLIAYFDDVVGCWVRLSASSESHGNDRVSLIG